MSVVFPSRTAGVVHKIGLSLQERPMPMPFVVPHSQEDCYDADPVKVVGDDGAIGCGVLPAENGIEDPPASSAVRLWATALENSLEMNREHKERDG